MIYKIIAIRGFWSNAKFGGQSRMEFMEESDLDYDDFWKSKLEEFSEGGWIINVSQVKEEVNGKNQVS